MDVLVVDDELALVTVMCEARENVGYTTGRAGDGQQALALLQATTQLPCLILMDVMMPRMLGWTFRQHQLPDPRLAAIPLVLMSGGAGDRLRAAQMQAAFLLKPFDLPEVVALAATHCGPQP